MAPSRFKELTSSYRSLRIGVVGDVCLDRYLEIDPAKTERSIETGQPVHNVVNVRTNPGAAGTVINNLSALGVKTIYPIGFCGDDAEGFELRRALKKLPQVALRYFETSPLRRTFTYTKPLVVEPGKSPRELNRLDFKNWTPTPVTLDRKLARSISSVAGHVDAIIVLDQVDRQGTGVINRHLLRAVRELATRNPSMVVLADSRRGLRDFPPLIYKMNRAELGRHGNLRGKLSLDRVRIEAVRLAKENRRPVFVTLAEGGIIGALPSGQVEHVPAFPARGEIDIVGAGDAVTANLAAALTCGAMMREALELAMAAASVVVHKLGTTGTASLNETKGVLFGHTKLAGRS